MKETVTMKMSVHMDLPLKRVAGLNVKICTRMEVDSQIALSLALEQQTIHSKQKKENYV
jgi:hypothetical protein